MESATDFILYTYSNITYFCDAFRGDTDTQTSTSLHTGV